MFRSRYYHLLLLLSLASGVAFCRLAGPKAWQCGMPWSLPVMQVSETTLENPDSVIDSRIKQ